MSENLLFATTRSGVDFTREAFELLTIYPKYCIKDWLAKIELYRSESEAHLESNAGNSSHKSDGLIRQAQDEIHRAQIVIRDLSELQKGKQRMFTVNFERKAEVWRRTRIELGLERIEYSPHLYAALKIEMAMYKAENPRFSEKRYLDYINAEGASL